MFENSSILVTGGSGFVGLNLIKRLIRENPKIIRSTYHKKIPTFYHPLVQYSQSDLTDKYSCKAITTGMDYVFMCAAVTSGAGVMDTIPLSQVTPNVIMNALLLEAAYENKIKKFQFLSSTTVYPDVDYPVREEDFLKGELFDKYFCVAWMKIFSEMMCNMYSSKIRKPMPVVVVRPGNIYGEEDDFEWETSHAIPALMRRIIERHDPISVWGDGSDVKDFTHISDIIEGMVLAMKKIDTFNPINIASGTQSTLKEILEMMLEIDGYQNANIEYDLSKPTMIPKRLVSIEKAGRLLGYEPQIGLREGLTRTMNWYRKNKHR